MIFKLSYLKLSQDSFEDFDLDVLRPAPGGEVHLAKTLQAETTTLPPPLRQSTAWPSARVNTR